MHAKILTFKILRNHMRILKALNKNVSVNVIFVNDLWANFIIVNFLGWAPYYFGIGTDHPIVKNLKHYQKIYN